MPVAARFRRRAGKHRASKLASAALMAALCCDTVAIAPPALVPLTGAPRAAVTATGSFRADAAAAAATLQGWYHNSMYQARWWQGANALEAAIDYMQRTGSRAYLADLGKTYRAFHSASGFRNNFYDDEGWWALTWLAAFRLTRDQRYLDQAKSLFADMTGGWDGTCGGGIWWSKKRTYKNAIANELFLDVAAGLHASTPGDRQYEGWALREWHWFSHSGMLTGAHLVIDGLSNCRPLLSSPTWTYNQGVLIGGLVALSRATRDQSMLTVARSVANAVIASRSLSPGGILREPCETSSCGLDADMFKGVFAHNLGILCARVRDPAYRGYLRENARSVWDHDRRGTDFGLHWRGPFDQPNVPRQAAALDLLNTQLLGALARGGAGFGGVWPQPGAALRHPARDAAVTALGGSGGCATVMAKVWADGRRRPRSRQRYGPIRHCGGFRGVGPPQMAKRPARRRRVEARQRFRPDRHCGGLRGVAPPG